MNPARVPRLGSIAWAELEDANGFGKVRPVGDGEGDVANCHDNLGRIDWAQPERLEGK